MIIKYLLVLAISFCACLILMPVVIACAKKLKLRQTVLHYVDAHAGKSGTPTMGGVVFVMVTFAVTLIFSGENNSLAFMLAILTLGFALIGFLDDFIKVFFHRNEGLLPWQKIVFQSLTALIVSVFVYNNPVVGDKLYLPFTMREISLGVFAVPFYAFIFIAFTNAVNLTDGLDGLAGKTGVVYTAFFVTILLIVCYAFGVDEISANEYKNISVFCFALIGSTCAFLIFNSYPAKIFMGDTGSLALGGAFAGLAVMSKMSLIAPVIGVVYVISCLSDVIQVLHYKRTKKRVFLMAPFHHHLEKKGWHENKIVSLYTALTFLVGVFTLIITIALV